ncbi:ribonuclease H [Trifolium pratense]|uniref:Ribonuclease H n=1 Tax=Trifolium pratense TaxID=57577 RepID=A0A2K3LZR1_TRIPR|nr:ribonuclease H [Trifolium pratense]
MDGVLAINEVVDWVKKAKKECLIFKVDFEKAYDSVSWSILDYMLRRFGFDDKWRSWVRACVFAGRLSVLVNGSPTEQIDISKGLKQGDPLAPFLFILVAEGLGALMKRAVDLEYFKGIQICNSGETLSHLQYADDTLFVGEACVENLWTIKAILRWFELISGLKVNFFKSKLFGINVGDDFINSAADFLNCKIGSLPFVYLGLPVGGNPRRASTWNPVLEVLQRRLASWKNKYVSHGGRVVLLNSVLAAIPIFYLSLFKMPVGVWKKIIRLQRRFLWGGAAGASKIPWVNWQDVCRSKKEGGLGVKDLRIMNISLLAKWKWRLLSEGDSIWKNVLRDKYGGGESGDAWMSTIVPSAKASPWWNDLMNIGVVNGIDHLVGSFFKKIGNGGTTRFWHDSWLGPQSLKEIFPRLFLISVQKECSVQEVGRWNSGRWEWVVRWRRNLFVWEEELQQSLMELLTPIQLANVENVLG